MSKSELSTWEIIPTNFYGGIEHSLTDLDWLGNEPRIPAHRIINPNSRIFVSHKSRLDQGPKHRNRLPRQLILDEHDNIPLLIHAEVHRVDSYNIWDFTDIRLEWPSSQLSNDAINVSKMLLANSIDFNWLIDYLNTSTNKVALSQILNFTPYIVDIDSACRDNFFSSMWSAIQRLSKSWDQSLQIGVISGIRRFVAGATAEQLQSLSELLDERATPVELSITFQSLAHRMSLASWNSSYNVPNIETSVLDAVSQYAQSRLIHSPENHAVVISGIALLIAYNNVSVSEAIKEILPRYRNKYLLNLAKNTINYYLTQIGPTDPRYVLKSEVETLYGCDISTKE